MTGPAKEEPAATADEDRTEQEPALEREIIEDLEPQEDKSGDLRGGRPLITFECAG